MLTDSIYLVLAKKEIKIKHKSFKDRAIPFFKKTSFK